MEEDVAPEFHEQVVAPDAVNVAVPPEQTEEALVLMFTVGVVVTVIVKGADGAEQVAVAPINVQAVVTEGATTIFTLVEPVLHVKLGAPLPNRVSELPEHILVENEEIPTVGVIYIVIACVFVLEQGPLFPVTVQVAFVVGETTIAAFVDPVFQEYVAAPPAVNVTEFPVHKVVELAVILTVGVGVTVIV